MRPSLFLLPTVLVVALAVACQPADEHPAAAADAPVATPAAVAAPPSPADAGADEYAVIGATPEAFRATGNEPGWLAQVGTEGNTALRVEVDLGQTRYEVAAPTHGPDGWAGTAADGTPVKLSIQRVACQDDMSGKEFEATAMLTVGARQLHGCGDFSATAE